MVVRGCVYPDFKVATTGASYLGSWKLGNSPDLGCEFSASKSPKSARGPVKKYGKIVENNPIQRILRTRMAINDHQER